MDERTISLEQLRAFVAVVDEGSFARAGRALGRVQSAVSHAVAALEDQVGEELFDRSGHRAVLTPAGVQALAQARRVLEQVHGFANLADELSGRHEAEVAIAVEAMFPIERLVCFAHSFEERWSGVRLRLLTEALSVVPELVLDGTCALGIGIAPLFSGSRLELRTVTRLQLVRVAAPGHPLAAHARPLRPDELAPHTQIVLSGRGREASEPDRGVLSSNTWRVLDLGAKQALILAGLGWGGMPLDRVAADLEAGRLRRIEVQGAAEDAVDLAVAWPRGRRLGPVARWCVDTLGG